MADQIVRARGMQVFTTPHPWWDGKCWIKKLQKYFKHGKISEIGCTYQKTGATLQYYKIFPALFEAPFQPNNNTKYIFNITFKSIVINHFFLFGSARIEACVFKTGLENAVLK
jgi:hypothetical protein